MRKEYEPLEVEDNNLGKVIGQYRNGNSKQAFVWGCMLVVGVTFSLVRHPIVKLLAASPLQQHQSPLQQHQNASFPGMNDTTTTLECCAARVIVELERHYSQDSPLPFTTLQFDNSNETMCGSFIESVENYPGCCGLPSNLTNDDEPFGQGTIPFWVENCIPLNSYTLGNETVNANMTGFMVYYDACPAYLLFDTRSCRDWINQTKTEPWEIVDTVSLVDGEFTGTVVVSPNLWHGKSGPNSTSIFIPDVFDSCWQIDCAWGGNPNTTTCIQFAQENLRKVSLAHYINTMKHVMCE